MSDLTSRATSGQLRAILDIAMGSRRGRLLSEYMEAPERLREVLVRTVGAIGGESPLAAVCRQGLSVDALIKIKDQARLRVQDSRSDEERVAFTLLYHAANAAAVIRFGANISSRPLASRLSVYEDLADALSGDELACLFRDAADRIFLQEGCGKDGESA